MSRVMRERESVESKEGGKGEESAKAVLGEREVPLTAKSPRALPCTLPLPWPHL